MDAYTTGKTIKELRIKQNLTQQQLADKLFVSSKTISKWETEKGFPDVSLLEPLAKVLNISVSELISGERIINNNTSANVFKTNFYVCPVCGNILYSMGDALISCHGVHLKPLDITKNNEKHLFNIEIIEDELYVSLNHIMEKTHYISFIAAISPDKIQFQKLYPEGEIHCRFKRNGVRFILAYCSQDGLFSCPIK